MPCSWSFSLQQASKATRNEPCAPLLRASQQRLRAMFGLFVNIPRHVGCEHPRTIELMLSILPHNRQLAEPEV
eukprot:908829-Pelagomonas_calceolata.AAC.1